MPVTAPNIGSQFDGQILHFNSVRLRVKGNGNLQVALRSLDDTNIQQLANIAMLSATDREPLDLANFINQRAQVHIFTTDIDETFNISRIIIFIKPIFSSFPQ